MVTTNDVTLLTGARDTGYLGMSEVQAGQRKKRAAYRTGLAAAAAERQDLGGRQKDVEGQPYRDVLDVKQVVRQFFPVVFQGDVVATVDLGPSRRPWLYQPALAIERNSGRVFLLLLRHKGTRTNECHVSLDDIDQLRQLVEPRGAQPFTQTSDALVLRSCWS